MLKNKSEEYSQRKAGIKTNPSWGQKVNFQVLVYHGEEWSGGERTESGSQGFSLSLTNCSAQMQTNYFCHSIVVQKALGSHYRSFSQDREASLVSPTVKFSKKLQAKLQLQKSINYSLNTAPFSLKPAALQTVERARVWPNGKGLWIYNVQNYLNTYFNTF